MRTERTNEEIGMQIALGTALTPSRKRKLDTEFDPVQAVVLVRDALDSTEARVLLSSCSNQAYTDVFGDRRAVTITEDLAQAAKERAAEELLNRGDNALLSQIALVFDALPIREGTTAPARLKVGTELHLGELDEMQNCTNLHNVDGKPTREEFFVLVTRLPGVEEGRQEAPRSEEIQELQQIAGVEMATKRLDIGNELQEVKNKIIEKEAALTAIQGQIEQAEADLKQPLDERSYTQLNNKLEDLRHDKQGLRAELVELQGQKKNLLSQPQVSQDLVADMKRMKQSNEELLRRTRQKTANSGIYHSQSLAKIAEDIVKHTVRLPVRFRHDGQHIQMHLTDDQWEKSKSKYKEGEGDLPQGPYTLGRCKLPSELYLVQPLAENMLRRLVSELPAAVSFNVFDTHDTPLEVLGQKKVDIVVTCDVSTGQPQLQDQGIADSEELLATFASSDHPTIPKLSHQAQPLVGFYAERSDRDSGNDGQHVSGDDSDAPYHLDADDFEDSDEDSVPDDFALNDCSTTAITATNAALLIELKKHRAFNNDARTQILECLEEFLIHAPLRKTIFGVLTDLQKAEVFSMTRDPQHRGKHTSAYHGDYTGAEIYPMLKALLSRPKDVLDCDVLVHNGQQVEFMQRLGRGAFGRVLQVSVGGEEFALKMLFDDGQSVAAERVLMEEVLGMANMPTACGAILEAGVERYLLFAPVGVPHGKYHFTRALAIEFLDGVAEVHRQKGIVHRDLRPSNIIFDGERAQLVLIDWGCAVKINDCGQGVPYCGSRAYKAHRLFADSSLLRNYVPSALDDLGSLLLLVVAAYFVTGGQIEAVDFSDQDESTQELDWVAIWHARTPPRWWQTYQQLGDLDYDTAVEQLRAHFMELPATSTTRDARWVL